MTLTTTDAACESLSLPIRYAWDETCELDEKDGWGDTANECDRKDTVADILKVNAEFEELCEEG